MMMSSIPSVLIVALAFFAVAMVTAAPLASNNKEAVSDMVAQADIPVDRAKRMDEKIFYGNEQNKARTVEKKSGSLLGPKEPQGDVDQGAEVIVHKEQPVPQEVKDRIDVSQDDSVQREDYAKEVESNMHSIVSSVLSDKAKDKDSNDVNNDESVDSNEHVTDTEDSVPNAAVPAQDSSLWEETSQPEVSQEEPEEVGTSSEEGTENEAEQEAVSEGEATEADDEEKELQEMTSTANSKATGDEDSLTSASSADEDEDVEASPGQSDDQQSEYGYRGEFNDPTNLFYNYLKMYRPYSQAYPAAPLDPYYLATRRRRSSVKARRNRRIKRDLLDDRLYNLYETPSSESPSYYPGLDVDDALLAKTDDYVPLSEGEDAVLYSRLLNYLEDALANEEAAAIGDDSYEESPEDEIPYEPELLPVEDEEEFEDEPYLTEPAYSSEMPSPYDDGYPYGPVDLDTYNSYTKRGREPYFPRQNSKRSFFPYNEEPDTHWGAFVPEKRDYNDAIQRLQRLAMALSDNSSPYYREILDDYRRK